MGVLLALLQCLRGIAQRVMSNSLYITCYIHSHIYVFIDICHNYAFPFLLVHTFVSTHKYYFVFFFHFFHWEGESKQMTVWCSATCWIKQQQSFNQLTRLGLSAAQFNNKPWETTSKSYTFKKSEQLQGPLQVLEQLHRLSQKLEQPQISSEGLQ